ncbi:MAG: hypothetical protein PHC34_12255 [Candidatus Gastranaerophilales bacterium]|nr:hypothetical protein [Candidatus Gastranaerophilales bacterium]
MKIGLSSAQQQNSNNSLSFQAGEFNQEFAKRLTNSIDNVSNAQSLLRCVRRDTITYTPERLQEVKNTFIKTDNQGVQHYLNRIVEIWSKFVK